MAGVWLSVWPLYLIINFWLLQIFLLLLRWLWWRDPRRILWRRQSRFLVLPVYPERLPPTSGSRSSTFGGLERATRRKSNPLMHLTQLFMMHWLCFCNRGIDVEIKCREGDGKRERKEGRRGGEVEMKKEVE